MPQLASWIFLLSVQTSRRAQGSRPVGLFPGQIQVITAKVPVSSYLAVDGAAQVQVADDGTRTQIEVLA